MLYMVIFSHIEGISNVTEVLSPIVHVPLKHENMNFKQRFSHIYILAKSESKYISNI